MNKINISVLVSAFSLMLIHAQDFKSTTNDEAIYKEIQKQSFESEEDFTIFVEKFYRDLAVYGIFPYKPKPDYIIIKFSYLDKVNNLTHSHGVSLGKFDDERIEIYINPTSWQRFKKPMRYFLMYHELAHDILNLDDLEISPQNKGKLMYPELWEFDQMRMDEFIESYQTLFEEIGNKKNK